MEPPTYENTIRFVSIIVVMTVALGVLYYSVGMNGVYTMLITITVMQWIQKLGGGQ